MRGKQKTKNKRTKTHPSTKFFPIFKIRGTKIGVIKMVTKIRPREQPLT